MILSHDKKCGQRKLSESLVFTTASLLAVALGLYKSKHGFKDLAHKGKRVGAVVHILSVLSVWVMIGLVIYIFGSPIFRTVWREPVYVAITTCISMSTITYIVARRLSGMVFGRNSLDGVNYEMFSHKFSQKQREVIAVHEVGHLLAHATIATNALPETVAKVGGGMKGVAGYVRSMKSVTQSPMPTEAWLKWECQMLMAGVIAEYVVYGQGTYGADSDMRRWHVIATVILQNGLTEYPFPAGDNDRDRDTRWHSYNQLLKDHRTAVFSFINKNKGLLFNAANELQFKGTLKNKDCRRILKQVKGKNLIQRVGRHDLEL